MENRPKNPGRRFQVLALLDGRHPPPKDPGYWSAYDVAGVCGISTFAALHLLARSRKYGILVAEERVSAAAYVKKLPGRQGPREGTLPVRTLAWSVTEKGKERLLHFGGHAQWCPVCTRKP